MAQFPAVILGAGLAYFGLTGRLPGLLDKFRSQNESESDSSSSNQQIQPPTQIVMAPMHNPSKSSYLLPLGCAGFFSLSIYFWYIESRGTTKVISKVEETAEDTQDLVAQCDDNNAKRFEVLDERNTERIQNSEIQVRTETRNGFNRISEQLYCLTQVCITNLTSIAKGNQNDEVDNGEQLLAYADSAQQMADTILSDEHLLKTKQGNLNDIRAEIALRNNDNMNKQQMVTPGGPSDPFDVQPSPFVTNITYKDLKNDDSNDANKENNEENADKNEQSIFSEFRNKFKIIDLAMKCREYWEYKNIIGCAGVAFCCGVAYLKQRNNKQKHILYHQV